MVAGSRRALIAAVLLATSVAVPAGLAARPAAGGPFVAGLYASPVQAGGVTYLWDEEALFRVRTGPFAEAITGPSGEALSGVRGIAPVPAAQGAIWLWTRERVLSLLSLQTAAAEITRVDGAPLGDVRGAVVDAGGAVWAWTDDGLFRHRFGTQAEEITAGGAPLEGIVGVVPLGADMLAWGRSGVFRAGRLTTLAGEVLGPGSESLRAAGSVVSGAVARVWNGGGAWVVAFGGAQPLTDGSGTPLTGVLGMVASGNGPAWLWTGRGVFAHGGALFSSQSTEVLHQGASISGVRGLTAGPAGTTWFWTEDRLFAHQLGSTTAVEVTAPGGGGVRDVQGVVSGDGGTFVWTDRRVLGFEAGGTTTLEITAPGGGSLAGVRGIAAAGSRVVLWTGDRVLLHQPASVTTVDVTAPGGGPIGNAWAAVPQPGSGIVWIRNHAATYVLGQGTTATEVLEPGGGRIASPPYNLPLSAVALTRTGGAGIGATGSLAPGVSFGGGVTGAVRAGTPVPFPLGLTSIVAGGGLQAMLGGAAASADGAGVLATGMAGDFLSLAIAFETNRASVDAAGREGNGRSSSASVSASGRFVAFESNASNLVPGDSNGAMDVFLHDRETGTSVRAAPPGVEPNVFSMRPALAAGGRHVSFESAATNLVAGDTNGQTDTFLFDRKAGAVERVSVPAGGGQAAGGGSAGSAVSASGRVVAFASRATNLVPGDTNGLLDVFVRDRDAGTTRRVSVSSAGAQGNGLSFSPALSADGRFVAFTSLASNLVPGDTNGDWDVFVHDRVTGRTERVSVSSGGRQQTSPGEAFDVPALSARGRFVAFDSAAPDLVPGDTNGARDVFVRDRESGSTRRVSVTEAGGQANGRSGAPSISLDGRFVAFHTDAPNLLDPGAPPGLSIVVRDRVTGTLRRASRTFLDSAHQTELGGFDPSLSGDGRFVAFTSAGETRAGAVHNGLQDVLVRDLGARDLRYPWMQHGRGAIQWRSDAFVHNAADHPVVLDATYFKRGLPDPNRPVEGLTVGAHETAFLEDVLPELLGVDPAGGAVGIDRVHPYSPAAPVATFQVRNPAPGGGFFGQAGSALPETGGDAAATRVQTLFGLNLTADKITLLGVNNPSDRRATYRLSLFDRQGNLVGRTQTLAMARDGHVQFQPEQLAITFGLAGLEDFRVEVETLSGGPVHAFASTVRIGSGDSIFIPAARPGRRVVHVLGALATRGAQNTVWTTDAVLHNPGAVPVTLRMTFTSIGLRGSPQPLGPPVVLAPGETRRLEDVLQNRGLSGVVGVLTVASDGTPGGVYPMVAAEGIQTSDPGGLYGRFTPALPDAEAAETGERSILAGLRQNADYRTTVWLYNPSGEVGRYRLRYRDLDGNVVAAVAERLGTGKATQINPSKHPAAVDGLAAFTLDVEVLQGRLLTGAAVVDGGTDDPSFVAGARR